MKILISLIALIFLTNCSSHSVKLGRKCTKMATNSTYEKSFIWIVDKKNLETFGDKIKILDKVVDGKALLSSVNVFVGSGGTMTAESALSSVPTISYNAVPNIIENYLVRKKLIVRERNPKRIAISIKKLLDSTNSEIKVKSKNMLHSMEDPYPILIETINSILKH